MSLKNSLFASESASEGDPDKREDRISDAVADSRTKGDNQSAVTRNTIVTTNPVSVTRTWLIRMRVGR